MKTNDRRLRVGTTPATCVPLPCCDKAPINAPNTCCDASTLSYKQLLELGRSTTLLSHLIGRVISGHHVDWLNDVSVLVLERDRKGRMPVFVHDIQVHGYGDAGQGTRISLFPKSET